MAKDRDYRRMIHSARWVSLRSKKLLAHPCCEDCEKEGYVTAACEVHHRVPVENGVTLREKETLMFDWSNLVALCHRCHVERHVAMGRSGREVSSAHRKRESEGFNARFFGDGGENN